MTSPIENLYDFAVMIKRSNGEIGSGFLYSSKANEDYVYILTAKHCIYGKNFKDLYKEPELTISYFGKDKLKHIKFRKSIDKVLSSSNKRDCAILLISKTRFPKRTLKRSGKIQGIKLLEVDNGEACYFRGFPKARQGEGDGSELFDECRLNDRTFKDKQTFKINIKNYDSNSSHASELLEGCSGSGILVQKDNRFYLLGIVQRYLKKLPKVVGRGLYEFNTLLQKDDYSTIPIYGDESVGPVGVKERLKKIQSIFRYNRISQQHCNHCLEIIDQLRLEFQEEKVGLLLHYKGQEVLDHLEDLIKTFRKSSSIRNQRQLALKEKILDKAAEILSSL